MKTLAVFSAVLSLLNLASASSGTASKSTSSVQLPSTFKPPQVFKNANLVHVVSVEKNFVKENINVLIENIDKEPQDQYFLPFTPDQLSRLGGLEVKDCKDASAGPFTAEVVEFDPTRYACASTLGPSPGRRIVTDTGLPRRSEVQHFRITLPSPSRRAANETLGISYFLLKAYSPLPRIRQAGRPSVPHILVLRLRPVGLHHHEAKDGSQVPIRHHSRLHQASWKRRCIPVPSEAGLQAHLRPLR